MSEVSPVSQEWYSRPTHAVWLRPDLLVGDGLITDIVPDYFVQLDDGIERLRFGKSIGVNSGPELKLPIVPDLLSDVYEAAQENCAEAVFVEELEPGAVAYTWQNFFRQVLSQARTVIRQPVLYTAERLSEIDVVVSLIDPRPEILHKNLSDKPSLYDGIDALQMVNNAQAADHEGRLATAQQIREHFMDRQPMTRLEMKALDAIRDRAMGYLLYQ